MGMRELLDMVVGLDDAARRVEEHLNREPAWARDDMTDRAQLQRESAEVTPVHPNNANTKVEPIKVQDVDVEHSPHPPEPILNLVEPESPEPEPFPIVDSFQVKEAAEYLKDRMMSSSAAQGSRLHALEVSIDTLAQCIRPLVT